MLIYFPTPYPDELLYSVCARYHYYVCNCSLKDTTHELFGAKTACAVVDLPSHLQYLCEQLPSGSSLTPESIIYNNTLFPLFQPFLSLERVQKLIDSMKSSNKGRSIHNSIGVMASGITAPKYLRYCKKCYQEDEKLYGEPYWHRVHQVAGVKICPRHGMWLEEADVNALSVRNKHEFHLLKIPLKSQSLETIDLSKYYFLWLKIAEAAAWLLSNQISSSKLAEIRKCYLTYLESKSLATSQGRLKQGDLIKEFTCFFSETFLDILNCRVDLSQDNWLCRLLRKPRNVYHPLRHILLMIFLGIGPEQFFNKKVEKFLPFGLGPWPCLNPVSGHYRKLIIKKIEITQDSKLKCPVGHFRCTCGFHYSRRGPDKVEQDPFKIGRIQSFGPIWEKELVRLTNEKGRSIREIAKILNVDSKTVLNQLTHLNGTTDCDKSDLCLIKKESYRNRWDSMIQENPDHSKTQLRHLEPSVYAWLYRNDREWLMGNSPVKKSKFPNKNNRVSWEQRDQDLHDQVLKTVPSIMDSQIYKSTRITRSFIGKEIGQLMIVQKHLDKLPKTRELLKTVTENKERFRIRRIREAIFSIDDQGLDLKPWRIAREAGVRPEYMSMVIDELNSSLN